MNGRLPLWLRGDRLIVMVALLAVVCIGLVTYSATGTTPPPYSGDSVAPEGTLALARWIGALGDHVQRLGAGDPLPGEARFLIMLEPQSAFTRPELAATLDWIAHGGTLLLLEDGGDPALRHALHLSLAALPTSADPFGLSGRPIPYGAASLQPLLLHPPLRGLSTETSVAISGSTPAVVPLLGRGGVRRPGARGGALPPPDPAYPILVYEPWGSGHVYAGTTPEVLTNAAIASGDNRRLPLNLLNTLPIGTLVVLDERHLLPLPAAAAPTLSTVLVSTAWGRALLATVAVIALYLLLTGRRLGRPLRPLPERGRSLGEYVISTAALYRRAGLRNRVLALWQDDLRTSLSGPGGMRGRDDATLVAEAAQRLNLEVAEQGDLLAALRPETVPSEAALLARCRTLTRLQERLAQARGGSGSERRGQVVSRTDRH